MGTVETGYSDKGYLDDPYLSGQIEESLGFQVKMIVGTQKVSGFQTEMITKNQSELGMQAAMTINTQPSFGMQALMENIDKENPLGMQTRMFTMGDSLNGMQSEMHIDNISVQFGLQVLMEVLKLTAKGMQTSMAGKTLDPLGMQALMESASNPSSGMEAKADTLQHWLFETGYLEDEYLEHSYLAEGMRAMMHMQAEMYISKPATIGMQAKMVIEDQKITGFQTEMHVEKETPTGMQALMLKQSNYGMQSTMVIYNVTQLRIITEFASRGTSSGNWTSNPAAASGDFGTDNLNTDIIEQVYRSTVISLVELTCDTGIVQGVPIDTIAILGHNLTSSAVVQVQGSKDGTFSPPDITFNMTTEVDNMYWVAPTFPTVEGQNRYWRFIIQDPTNSAGYLEIGAIIFGVANIFSVSESFLNPLRHGYIHFKDAIQTEGFTNIMNDRALKKFLKLEFEKLNYFKGNYGILRDLIVDARTSLKCLIIPTPEYASRFAIFAKLVNLPEISHTSIDETTEYVDLGLEWDESL